MAIEEFLAVFRGDVGPLGRAIKEAHGELGKLQAQAEKTHSSVIGGFAKWTAIATAGAAVGGLSALLFEGVKAANADAVAMGKLNTAFADAGGKWTPELRKQLEETQAKMRGLGYENAATLDSVFRLTQAGVPLNEAIEKQGQVADFARARNLDLGEATRMLILATQGNMRAVKDLGIEGEVALASAKALKGAQDKLAEAHQKVTEAIAKHGAGSKEAQKAEEELAKAQGKYNQALTDSQNHMLHFGDMMDQVSGRTAGQAEAYRHTLPGALSALRASFLDMAAKIGDKVIPYLLQLSEWITGHQAEISAFASQAIAVLGQAFSLVGDVLKVVGPPLITVLGFLLGHSQTLIPILVTLGTVLTVMAVKQLVEWTVSMYRAVAATVAAGISALRLVAYYAIMAYGVTARIAIITASWVAQRVATLAGFALQVAGAIAAYTLIAARAVASAVVASAAWIAQRVVMLTGFALQVAGALAAYAVIAAEAMATGIAMAAAWFIGLGPIAWIIAAILALGAVFVVLYNRVDWFRNGVNAIWNWIKDHTQLFVLALITILTGGLGGLVYLALTHLSQIRDFFGGVWNAISSVAKTVWHDLLAFFGAILGAIGGAFTGAWNGITAFLAAAWNGIANTARAVWNGVTSWIGNLIKREVDGWKAIFNVFAGALGNVWNTIKSVAQNAWNGIVSVIKGAINILINAIDAIIRGINSIHIHVPEIGVGPVHTPGGDFSLPHIPEIPRLHRGGTVPGLPGTDVLALLQAGEGIIPLNVMQTVNANVAQAKQTVSDATSGAGITIGQVITNNAKQGLDVVSEVERALWLAKFQVRGIIPPTVWPGEEAA